MALKGALSDLGIVDLIQFPHAGHKTGELVISNEDREAKLNYVNGKLVHTTMGTSQGIDVLVDILGWSDGEFEFRQGVAAESVSIDMDLHRAVMTALKIRDERKQEEERRKEKAQLSKALMNETVSGIVKDFISASSSILHASIVEDGCLFEINQQEEPPEKIVQVRKSLLDFNDGYPNSGLRRIFIDDDMGTIVLSRIDERKALIVVADREASMGVVSMLVNKLATRLLQGEQS